MPHSSAGSDGHTFCKSQISNHDLLLIDHHLQKKKKQKKRKKKEEKIDTTDS